MCFVETFEPFRGCDDAHEFNVFSALFFDKVNGCFMADCQAVLDIRNDLAATMDECREVTEQYSTGRSAYLRLGQLFMRLFAGLL